MKVFLFASACVGALLSSHASAQCAPPPTNLVPARGCGNAVNVSWSSVPGTDYYSVRRGVFPFLNEVATTTNPFYFDTQAPLASISYQVIAVVTPFCLVASDVVQVVEQPVPGPAQVFTVSRTCNGAILGAVVPSHAVRYFIRRAAPGGGFQLVANDILSPGEILSWNDTSIAPNTEYRYRLSFWNQCETEGPFVERTFTWPGPQIPPAPTLAPQVEGSCDGIRVTLPASDSPLFLRRTVGGFVWAYVGGQTTTYPGGAVILDNIPSPGLEVTYAVQADSQCGASPIGVPSGPVARSLPLNVEATVTASYTPGCGAVRIDWNRTIDEGRPYTISIRRGTTPNISQAVEVAAVSDVQNSYVDASGDGSFFYWVVATTTCETDRFQAAPASVNGACCDSIDFNNDTSLFDPQDIDAFLSVYSEGPCIPATATCNDIDFNNDGSLFDPCDIDSFLLVFSEGPCTLCGV